MPDQNETEAPVHRPSSIEAVRFEVTLQRRLHTFKVMETARRGICCYMADPCDCKYGASPANGPATEATGCCELRDLIQKVTGWFPYNDGRTPLDEWVEGIGNNARTAWLADYSDSVATALSASTTKEAE